MASVKFLEEALSTDVDESAVSAIVGSLETQLVNATAATHQNQSQSQNHQLHDDPFQNSIPNGDSMLVDTESVDHESPASASLVASNAPIGSTTSVVAATPPPQSPVQVAATVATNHVNPTPTIQLNVPLLPPNVQVVNIRPNSVPSQQQVQMSTNASVASSPVINQPKNVQTQMAAPRVVLGGQQMITLQGLSGLQSGQGHLLLKTENGQLQLVRVGPLPVSGMTKIATPATSNAIVNTGQATYRLQTLPAVSRMNAPLSLSTTGTTLALNKTLVQTVPQQQPNIPTSVQSSPSTNTSMSSNQPQTSLNQKQAQENTKEKCRKFLANLLELSSREPKQVERNVRNLIQELIDSRVEPEDFCDRLERLLNASPQPCLIGFLKKSLPLLRQSLVTKELTIDGIRPPPHNVAFQNMNVVNQVQNQIKVDANQQHLQQSSHLVSQQQQQQQQQQIQQQQAVRLPNTATNNLMIRPGQTIIQQPQRLTNGTNAQQAIRMSSVRPQLVTTTQPPALHPVYTNINQQTQNRSAINIVRNQIQSKNPNTQQTSVRTVTTPMQIRTPLGQFKTVQVAKTTNTLTTTAVTTNSSSVTFAKPFPKEKEKKTFSAIAYTGDDDINDVAAMGGVNLAEETQKILGSTEFVGTQIRSCKDEYFVQIPQLQQRIKEISIKYDIEDISNEVSATISHAAEEYLKNIIEKLAVITGHRQENLRLDQRYEYTTDIKQQLKFLEDLDRAERKRHDDTEREILLRAAKSRSKSEDPEQVKLKAKAKELQRAEMEETRQREANMTALMAIGPRKKIRFDDTVSSHAQKMPGLSMSNASRSPLQRIKRVSIRDLQFLLEQEKDTSKNSLLFKMYQKL